MIFRPKRGLSRLPFNIATRRLVRRVLMLGAVLAAKDLAIGLDAVPDHAAIAVMTFRRERVNRTLETVERVRVAIDYDFKCLRIIVSTNFAACHDCFSRESAKKVIQIGKS
jgi:hypothetical protein